MDLAPISGVTPALASSPSSHKEFTADATGGEERDLIPTVAAAVLASRAGADMLRLHDVAACRPALALADAVRGVEGA